MIQDQSEMNATHILWYPGSGTDLLPAFILPYLNQLAVEPEPENISDFQVTDYNKNQTDLFHSNVFVPDERPLRKNLRSKTIHKEALQTAIPFLCDFDTAVIEQFEKLIEVEDTEFFPKELQKALIGMYENIWQKYGFQYFENKVESTTYTLLNEKDKSYVEMMHSKMNYTNKIAQLPEWDLVHFTLYAVVEQKGEEQSICIEFLFSPLASQYCYEYILKTGSYLIDQIAIVRNLVERISRDMNREDRAEKMRTSFLRTPLLTRKLIDEILISNPDFKGIWSDRPIRQLSDVVEFSRNRRSTVFGWGMPTSNWRQDSRSVSFYQIERK